MKLLLKIKYCGDAYSGFQYQPQCRTVQGTLTECLSRAFGTEVNVTGCSRTDAGVHAIGYCAAVMPSDEEQRGCEWCTVPAGKVHCLVNRFMPSDMAVVGACYVEDTFHPRYDVVSKEYVYLIEDTPTADPFTADRVYHVRRRITDGDIEKMNMCAAHLVGKHDFAAFMAAGSKIVDTVRTLKVLSVERESGGLIKIRAEADGFLYNMVRILVGTLLDCACGKLAEEDMEKILAGRNRQKAGATAPACGLYLSRVEYGRTIAFEAD